MGAILSLASCACCCTSAACTVFSCCPGATSSTMTRVGYAFLLLTGLLFQLLAMSEWVATKLINYGVFKCKGEGPEGSSGFSLDSMKQAIKQVIPGFESGEETSKNDFLDDLEDSIESGANTLEDLYKGLSDQNVDPKCLYEASYFFVYRIAFSYFMFFLIMSILMIKVKDSSDIRAKWQNGFWGVKFLIIFASMIACLFIGEGGFDTFMYVLGLIGGFMFILYQLVLLVEFAHQLNETLLAKLDEVEDPRCIKFLLYLFSLGSYLAALVCVILMFVYFGPAGSGCGLNQFFISSALILSIVCGIFAIHPTVQEHQPTSGLVQAGCVSIYLCYMVYSSMTSNIMSKNNSGELCNSFSDLNGIKIFAASGLDLMNGNSIFGMIFAVVMVLYSTMSTSSLPGGDNAGSTASDIPMLESGTNSDGAKTLMVTAAEDETGNVKYNYSIYHLVMNFAILYIMVLLTNWQNPNNQENLPDMWPVVWIKIVSAWLAVLLYLWTLVAPILFPDRF